MRPVWLGTFGHSLLVEWRGLHEGSLRFTHVRDAELLMVAAAGMAACALFLRLLAGRRRRGVAVPLVTDAARSTPWARLTLLPLLIALLGLGALAVAVADPTSSLVRRQATYPGRRICLMIDASNSMSSPFKAERLRTQAATAEGGAFFSTVAAADRFVEMRARGGYRDLVALVEFGSEAYVVTPFTNDYDNLRTSLSLIGDPREFATFPDPRTLIARGIEESVELFKAFHFLDATGNLLIIFSDGEDTNATVHGRSLDDIIRGAVDAGVPVYLIRTNYAKREGDPAVPDALWRAAVRRSGGQFYAASDEQSLLAAIQDIDRVSAGTIAMTEYSQQLPRFQPFAAAAAGCFLLAALLKVGLAAFQRFP